MGEPVLVIVGEWECGDNGEWDFVIEKNVMAQSVMISPNLTYSGLQQQIRTEFGLKPGELEANLSFWMPNELSTVTQSKAPPVCIKSDNGLNAFREVREGRKWVTMFVSFSSCRGIDLNAGPSRARHCGRAVEPVLGSSSNWEYGTIRMRESTPSSADGIDPTNANLFRDGTSDRDESPKKMRFRGKGKALRFAPESGSKGTHALHRDGKTVVHLDDSCSSSEESQTWKDFLNAEAGETTLEQIDGRAAAHDTITAVPERGRQMIAHITDAVVPELGQTSVATTNHRGHITGQEVEQGNQEVELDSEETRSYGVVPQISAPSAIEHNIIRGAPSAVPENLVGGTEAGQSANIIEDLRLGRGENTTDDAEDEEMDEERTAYDVQCTLTNLYADIREGEVLPPVDAPAVFDDGYVLTGKEAPIEFDEADDGIYIGRKFKNKAEMQLILAIHAIKRLFTFRVKKSDTKRCIVKCVDKTCPWRVFGTVLGGHSETMEIRTATLYHTCDVTTRSQYGKKATPRVIAHVLKSKFANGRIGPKAKDIPDIIQDELRVSINYMKAWYAKEKAVANARGSEEASYKLLRGYMSLLTKANPGTVYKLQHELSSTGERRFKYLFFSLGASIAALPYLRKVIIIDGTAIKAKFQGCMLTASLQDGNFQVFPLAFAVVDGENEPAWTWFFSQLSTIIPDSTDLMFMSDRHSSIYAGLQTVYPLAHHGACSVHLYRNVKARFKGENLGYLVSRAARAYSVGEFRFWFSQIERRSNDCASYLREIGFPHWTSAYSPGKRYNISSTNIAETLNSTLAKALQFPIVSMVECIRMMLMKWFFWRRTKAANGDTILTPEAENLVMSHLEDATTHTVIQGSEWMFQVNTTKSVTYTVNLLHRTCTCRLFEKLGLPCSHALAAAKVCGLAIPTMSEPVYKRQFLGHTYAGVVNPVPNMEDEEVPEEHDDPHIIHPRTKRGSGRPRTRRIPSTGDGPRKSRRTGRNKCSRCFEPGHNRTTCRNALP